MREPSKRRARSKLQKQEREDHEKWKWNNGTRSGRRMKVAMVLITMLRMITGSSRLMKKKNWLMVENY